VFLIFLSVLWRDKLDGHFVKFSSWIEEVASGKKDLFSGLSGFAEGISNFKASLPTGNGHAKTSDISEKSQA